MTPSLSGAHDAVCLLPKRNVQGCHGAGAATLQHANDAEANAAKRFHPPRRSRRFQPAIRRPSCAMHL